MPCLSLLCLTSPSQVLKTNNVKITNSNQKLYKVTGTCAHVISKISPLVMVLPEIFMDIGMHQQKHFCGYMTVLVHHLGP
jgi:hypothetical protein